MGAQHTTSEHVGIGASDHLLDLRLLKFRNRPEGEDPAMLAIELALGGRTNDAIEVVDEALARDPEDLDLLLGCGVAAMRGGRLAFAQIVLTRAALADRTWTEPLRHLSDVLERRGRADRAIEVARHAVRAGERDPAVVARVAADDRRRALDARLASFRADPDREEPALLAQELAAQGRNEDALFVATTAIAREDDDADLRMIEARAQIADGDRDAAERALGRAIELAPGWAEPARTLADSMLERGALIPALTTIERAIAATPDDGSLGEARDRILAAMERAGVARPGVADAALDALLGQLDRIDPIGDDTRAGFSRSDTLVDAPAPERPARRTGWLPTIARTLFGRPSPVTDGAGRSASLAAPRLPIARA